MAISSKLYHTARAIVMKLTPDNSDPTQDVADVAYRTPMPEIHNAHTSDIISAVDAAIADVARSKHDHNHCIAIDFDNTIAHKEDQGVLGKPIDGALEFITQLRNQGWRVIIYSSRLNSPDGCEQICNWLDTHGIAVDELVAKPRAQWYIDDRALEFNGDWTAIAGRVLGATSVSPVYARRVAAGEISAHAIASNMGIDPDSFCRDLQSAFLSRSASDIEIMEHRMRSRYGLALDIRSYQARGAEYLQETLRDYVSKGTSLGPGAVVCVTAGADYGEIADVVDINANAITISVPGAAPRKVHAGHVKLASPAARVYAVPHKRTAIAVAPNDWYLEGLTYGQIQDYYHGFTIESSINVRPVYKFAHAYIDPVGEVTEIKGTSDLVALAQGKVIGFNQEHDGITVHIPLMHIADVAAERLAYLPAVENAHIIFDGKSGFYITCTLNPDFTPEVARGAITDAATALRMELASDIKCVASVPLRYSVCPETGLRHMPATLYNLANFDVDQARI